MTKSEENISSPDPNAFESALKINFENHPD